MRIHLRIPFWILFVACIASIGRAETKLLRFPTVHGDQLVFGHAGDLYTVSTQGGTARRLTSDEGYEMFPRLSPDGKNLAFTAQYDGNTEVYVMPADGGKPRRLSHTATLERDDVSDRMGPNNIVMTWRDNESLVFRSRRNQWNPFKGHLLLAFLDGRSPEELPLPRGGWCSYSPDGSQLAYNRVFREFRTWKRYRGGQADEIWIHRFSDKSTRKLAADPAQDIYPMWRGDRIYFVSERDENHQANLFVVDLNSNQVRQLTRFTEFAVKFPSMGDKAIAFENGGEIHLLDLASESTRKVSIDVKEDFAIGRHALRDVSKETTGWDVSPDGARMVIGARGDVFTVPAKHGPTRNLTRSPGTHERDATWSPDGRWIAYISDQSGEDELYVQAQDGAGDAKRLTSGGDTYKYGPSWSPDSRQLLWSDKKNRLFRVDVESREVKLVAESKSWEIHEVAWSPDSRWIAFREPQARRFSRLRLHSVDAATTVDITDGWFESGQPEFSSDGKLLFFVSERTFNPTYGGTEWNHVYNDQQNIFFVTLTRDAKSPFAIKSDEVKIKEAESGQTNKPPEKAVAGSSTNSSPDKKVEVRVDAEGIAGRIGVLPITASTYNRLTSVGDKLYYIRKGKLHVFEMEKQKETELADVGGYVVTADQKKMLIQAGGSFSIVDLPTGKPDLGTKLSLADLKVSLDREAEWRQIFGECWRQMRDFFYDPQLHGVDWAAMRKRYEPLVEHVHHRADLTYVLGEMIGELNAGHAYVGGGDYPKAERIPLGLLGARWQKDASGYFRITEILKGHNWDKTLRSPLTEVGVNVKVGDYILAVDGRSVANLGDLHLALLDTAGKTIRLRVNSAPNDTGAHDELVTPTANEQPLYYLNWVLGNIARVEAASNGRIGYVHVPDMGVPGLNEFAKFYYPQLHKDALIVDCRGNGGGNVSPMIVERLRREPAMWTVARNGSVGVDPGGQVLGPKVLLLDQFSASDGDIVAYRFRHHKLGPIIGQRSWGGVVGIRGSLPLLDGGTLNRPEFSRFDLNAREWIMEGVGVSPDIEVDNDPTREYAGDDEQLQRAIAEIQAALARQPVVVPNPPPYPDKRK